MVKLILMVLLCATSTFAQKLTRDDFLKPRPIEHKFSETLKQPTMIAATATCFGGATADLLTSHGRELNPLFQDSRGNIAKPRAAVTVYGICGAFVVLSKWRPRLAKMLSFAAGGVHIGAAIHNTRFQ